MTATEAIPVTVTEGDGEMYGALVSADIAWEAGITYRQLDHWVRQGYLKPGHVQRKKRKGGSGSPRIWPLSELETAKIMGRLAKAGLPLEMAHCIARSGQSRHEIAPGVWIEVRP